MANNQPGRCFYAAECAETGPGIEWYPAYQMWLGPRCVDELRAARLEAAERPGTPLRRRAPQRAPSPAGGPAPRRAGPR